MRFDRRLARDLAPFGATAVLAFALVPIQNSVEWVSYALAAALAGAAGLAILLAPPSLPSPVRLVPSVLFLLGVALLRKAGGGAVTGVGVLAALPVFWLALHGTRGELLATIGFVCVSFAVPALFVGVAEYPLGSWRLAAVFGAAAAIVGLTVQNLVGRVRGQAEALALRERDLEAMADLSRTLSGAPDARQRVCVAACDLSGAHFTVLLEGRAPDALSRTASAGVELPPETFSRKRWAAWAIAAYSSGAPVVVSSPTSHPDADPAAFAAADSPAAVQFEPVAGSEGAVGVLVVGWRRPPMEQRRTTGLVRLLASEAAFVIERADLVGRLTEIALTDTLTGLPNRRAWDDRLAQAIRDHEPICVALLDLDLFKSFNDNLGHQAGDRLLKEAAAAWRAQLRSTDMLARYGGEEFVVLLHGHDADAAQRVVERLRDATPGGQSCSAGIARREADEDAVALVARADAALYEAKRTGRNRSVIANPGVASEPGAHRA